MRLSNMKAKRMLDTTNNENDIEYMALPINIEDLLKKRKILFLLLTALMVASCSNPNEKYVKKAVRIMDRNGIYAHGIEWEKAKEEALNAKPSSLEEAQEIVQKVGKVAGGKHTFLMTDDMVNENDTTTWEMPTVELTDGGIAIVRLSHFMGNAEEGVRYTNTVLDALPDDLQGVVIDLRGNRGGNMYPMIAAVHRFLPDDVILKFSSRKKPMSVNTSLVMKTVGIEKQAPISCPVALLTDEWTASSGEAVLICFRGLANARTFGMPTAGYCSCNQIYTLPGGSQLALTIGEDIARTGEVFCDDPIEPDVTTETPLDDALEWIMHYKM